MSETTIVYICPKCETEVFWYHIKDRKTWLGQLTTPVSFTAVSNCDACATWIHKNFTIKAGLFSTEGISVQESGNV
jgi:hypothetical protein